MKNNNKKKQLLSFSPHDHDDRLLTDNEKTVETLRSKVKQIVTEIFKLKTPNFPGSSESPCDCAVSYCTKSWDVAPAAAPSLLAALGLLLNG